MSKENFFPSDKTPREIGYYKQVKAEFVESKDNGEENIKLKFINNIPKIVKNDGLILMCQLDVLKSVNCYYQNVQRLNSQTYSIFYAIVSSHFDI